MFLCKSVPRRINVDVPRRIGADVPKSIAAGVPRKIGRDVLRKIGGDHVVLLRDSTQNDGKEAYVSQPSDQCINLG